MDDTDNLVQFFDNDGHIPSTIIDYRQTVTNAIETSRRLLTNSRNHFDLNLAQQSVNALRALMIHKLRFKGVMDKDYIKQLDDLKDNNIKYLSTLKKRQARLRSFELRQNYISDQWEILLEFAGKHGLTEIKKIEVDMT